MIGKRLLIVTHVFAPSNHSNAKRPHLMAKYFVKQGWDVTVLTSSFQVSGGHAAVKDCDGIRVHCIRAWTLSLLEALAGNTSLRARTMSLFQATVFPDSFAPWVRKVARQVKTLDYDVAILNVLPYSGFLLEAQGVLDARWIIDYQESVYPFLERRPRTSPLQKLWTPKLLRLERRALRSCAGAWFTADSNRRRYIADGAIEESRTAHLPYFFDPGLYPAATEASDRKALRILYGGRLDRFWRSPETFFRAWKTFLTACPDAEGTVKFVLFGTLDAACWTLAEELGLKDSIDLCQPVSYLEFLAKAAWADLLLYLDAKDQEFFNPSKVADYFGAGKPILAFTARGSDVAGMLCDAGMESLLAGVDDAERGARNLKQFWENWKKGHPYRTNTQAYSVNSVCAKAFERIRQWQADWSPASS